MEQNSTKIQKRKKKEKKIEDDFVLILKALEQISNTSFKNGFINCPKCNNKLYYAKHPNNHIWGKCETKNCLNWVQ